MEYSAAEHVKRTLPLLQCWHGPPVLTPTHFARKVQDSEFEAGAAFKYGPINRSILEAKDNSGKACIVGPKANSATNGRVHAFLACEIYSFSTAKAAPKPVQQVRIARNGDGHGDGDDGRDGSGCDDGAGGVPPPVVVAVVVRGRGRAWGGDGSRGQGGSGEGGDVGDSGDGDGDDGDGDGEGACGGHPAASSQTCSRKIGRWVIHLRL